MKQTLKKSEIYCEFNFIWQSHLYKEIQNLIWATGYKVVALPLAAGVFKQAGHFIKSGCRAVLMTVSTIVVAINASILKVK